MLARHRSLCCSTPNLCCSLFVAAGSLAAQQTSNAQTIANQSIRSHHSQSINEHNRSRNAIGNRRLLMQHGLHLNPTTTQHRSLSRHPTDMHERTFIAVKPDGVQRRLVGEVIGRFEHRGYRLVAIKIVRPDEQRLRAHYPDIASRAFFPSVLDYMQSGAVVAMVWEGPDVINQARRMLGVTNPLKAETGTIRGDFGLHPGRNLVHGSDSPDSARREIALWFDEDEIIHYEDKLKYVYYTDED